MSKEIINNQEEVSLLYHSVSNLIETTKESVYHSINSELVNKFIIKKRIYNI